MKVVYIVGKFRGPTTWDVETNIREAEVVALKVWRAGAAALCPHTNNRFFDGAAPDEIFLPGAIEVMKRCDALVLVPNWLTSKGAKEEVHLARALNLPVFFSWSQPEEGVNDWTAFEKWLKE